MPIKEVDVGKDEEFTVSTLGAGGQGKLDVKITSPSRRPIPCKLESGTANEVHTVKYIPPEEGPYRVDISYDGNPVPGSPFTVEGVMPPDPSKVSSGVFLEASFNVSERFQYFPSEEQLLYLKAPRNLAKSVQFMSFSAGTN